VPPQIGHISLLNFSILEPQCLQFGIVKLYYHDLKLFRIKQIDFLRNYAIIYNMKKLWLGFKKDWRRYVTIASIALAVGIALFFIYIFVWKEPVIRYCCDASWLLFGIYFAIGVFAILIRLGTFDMLGYGANTMIHYMFVPKGERKYHDLIEYKNIKNETRIRKPHTYLIFFLISVLFLIALIVFKILWEIDLSGRV
jgi:hypothetical protein